MIQFWILRRFAGSQKLFFNLTSFFAILGRALGVGCLVVVMAVVSGYEATLKKSLVDLSGHLIVTKRGGTLQHDEAFFARLPEYLPEFRAFTPFVQVEAMIAHNKKVSGVIIEGLDVATMGEVLNFGSRLTHGALDLKAADGLPKAVIGQGIAKFFNIQVGDQIKLIRPISSNNNSQGMFTKLQEFVVTGIVDLGKIEYNERFVLTDIKVAQELKPFAEEFTGIKIRLVDDESSAPAAKVLAAQLGYPYSIRDWKELNHNLLEAIRIEKPVIFFVVLIMVIAACFNICSHLFVSVLKKYSAISILRAMGATQKQVVMLFSWHGMILGSVGIFIGLILGWLLSRIFVWIQLYGGVIPGET